MPDAAVPGLPASVGRGTRAAGSPGYLHRPQGKGRLDNPDLYDIWYLAGEASGAVGEVFADRANWDGAMFDFPLLRGARRALGVYLIPDRRAILDLDDARALLDRSLRPTQVIERNRPSTQRWARAIYAEPAGWAGIGWWSYRRPHWHIFGRWGLAPRCERVEQLALDHPAVVDAAQTLPRTVRRPRPRAAS